MERTGKNGLPLTTTLGQRRHPRHMRRTVSHAAVIGLVLAAPAASATGDFVCVADSPYGAVVFADAADSSDNAPLDARFASPSLSVGRSNLELSQTKLQREGAWYVFRDIKTGQPVFSMRQVPGDPIIPTTDQHPFCDQKNWRESCWAATLVFELSGQKVTVERALCGVG